MCTPGSGKGPGDRTRLLPWLHPPPRGLEPEFRLGRLANPEESIVFVLEFTLSCFSPVYRASQGLSVPFNEIL